MKLGAKFYYYKGEYGVDSNNLYFEDFPGLFREWWKYKKKKLLFPL